MSEAAFPAVHARSGNTAVFVLVGVAALELLAFVLGLGLGVQGWDVAILALALVTTLVGALPIVLDIGRPAAKRQFLISILALSYMLYIVVPVFSNYFGMKGDPSLVAGSFHLLHMGPLEIANGQIAALIGLIMLIVGFYSPFGRFVVSVIPPPTREWSPNATIIVAMMMLGLGWFIFLGGQVGIIPRQLGSGVLGTLASGSFLGIALLALCWLRHGSRNVIPLVLVIVPLAMFFNFFTGSKRQTLTPPFMIALAYMVYERRIRKSWVVGGLLMLIALYPIAQFYRTSVQSEHNRSAGAFLQDPLGTLSELSRFGQSAGTSSYLTQGFLSTLSRLDALGVLAVIVRDTPERVPYQGGWTLAMIPLSYIPRFIWQDKPGTTVGIWVAQSYGNPYDPYTHVGPSWIGELYFSFGYPGIVFGMFVVGVLYRMLQERLAGPTATIPALLGAIIVLYAVTRSIQGTLLGPVNGTVYNLVVIGFVHVLVGFFGGYMPRQARAPDPGARP